MTLSPLSLEGIRERCARWRAEIDADATRGVYNVGETFDELLADTQRLLAAYEAVWNERDALRDAVQEIVADLDNGGWQIAELVDQRLRALLASAPRA